jgi:hypothetical protein
VPVFFERLALGAAVILDDADRPDERLIVERWTKSFPALELEISPPCEKGFVVLRRR